MKKIDTIFIPHKINSDDAKEFVHPIDVTVFAGMKVPSEVKRSVLLDRHTDSSKLKDLIKSAERVAEHDSYEWVTLRV